jgi:hypothetical protein
MRVMRLEIARLTMTVVAKILHVHAIMNMLGRSCSRLKVPVSVSLSVYCGAVFSWSSATTGL